MRHCRHVFRSSHASRSRPGAARQGPREIAAAFHGRVGPVEAPYCRIESVSRGDLSGTRQEGAHNLLAKNQSSRSDGSAGEFKGWRKNRMSKIRVAIAGVGNCVSSLIQGLEYYPGA